MPGARLPTVLSSCICSESGWEMTQSGPRLPLSDNELSYRGWNNELAIRSVAECAHYCELFVGLDGTRCSAAVLTSQSGDSRCVWVDPTQILPVRSTSELETFFGTTGVSSSLLVYNSSLDTSTAECEFEEIDNADAALTRTCLFVSDDGSSRSCSRRSSQRKQRRELPAFSGFVTAECRRRRLRRFRRYLRRFRPSPPFPFPLTCPRTLPLLPAAIPAAGRGHGTARGLGFDTSAFFGTRLLVLPEGLQGLQQRGASTPTTCRYLSRGPTFPTTACASIRCALRHHRRRNRRGSSAPQPAAC